MNENLFEPFELLTPLSLEADLNMTFNSTVKCDKGFVCKIGEHIL